MEEPFQLQIIINDAKWNILIENILPSIYTHQHVLRNLNINFLVKI